MSETTKKPAAKRKPAAKKPAAPKTEPKKTAAPKPQYVVATIKNEDIMQKALNGMYAEGYELSNTMANPYGQYICVFKLRG